MKTLWLHEGPGGKLAATMDKPTIITGRLIAVTAMAVNDVVHFTDVTDGGFFSVPIQPPAPRDTNPKSAAFSAGGIG